MSSKPKPSTTFCTWTGLMTFASLQVDWQVSWDEHWTVSGFLWKYLLGAVIRFPWTTKHWICRIPSKSAKCLHGLSSISDAFDWSEFSLFPTIAAKGLANIEFDCKFRITSLNVCWRNRNWKELGYTSKGMELEWYLRCGSKRLNFKKDGSRTKSETWNRN